MTDLQILKTVNDYQMTTGQTPITMSELIAAAGMMPAWMTECFIAKVAQLERFGLLMSYRENIVVTYKGLQAIYR